MKKLSIVICLGVFFFGCEAKQKETTQEIDQKKTEAVSSESEVSQEAAQMQAVIKEKTKEVVQEMETNIPKIEQGFTETLKTVEGKTSETLEEVKTDISEMADQIAKETEQVREEFVQLPVKVSVPSQESSGQGEVSTQLNISVDQGKETIISQGRWAFSQHNLKVNYINYYDRDGNFLGRRSVD